MLDTKDLDSLDPECFHIIMDNKYDVSLMSQNTGYCWYVHCVGASEGGCWHVFFVSINTAIFTTGVVVVTVSSRQSGIFRVAICGK